MMNRIIGKETLTCWLLAALLVLSGIATPAFAGNLEPSAPPGPTMKTLSEVEPRTPVNNLRGSLDGTYRHIIIMPGSYYLSGDITTTSNGIFVAADNVTIDMMGYTLTGPGKAAGTYTGIGMTGRTNVEIRNGTIREFGGRGIYEDTVTGKAHRIISIRSLSNGSDGIYLAGYGHLVKDCTVADNGSVGIYGGSGGTVIDNTAYNNQGSGIYGGLGCTITRNTAYSNKSYGIQTDYGNTLTGNTVYSNQGSGIYGGSGCTATGNTAYNNEFIGINVSAGSTVIANTVYNNQYHGIQASDSTVMSNAASNNNQSGTDSVAGIHVTNNSLVKDNTAIANKWSNILVSGSSNAVEETLVTGSSYGIYLNAQGNFFANNRASGNTTNYVITSGNTDGGGNVSF